MKITIIFKVFDLLIIIINKYYYYIITYCGKQNWFYNGVLLTQQK